MERFEIFILVAWCQMVGIAEIYMFCLWSFGLPQSVHKKNWAKGEKKCVRKNTTKKKLHFHLMPHLASRMF